MTQQTRRNLLSALVVVLLGAGVTAVLIKTARRPERQTPPPATPLITAVAVAPDHEPVSVRGFGSVKAKRSIDVVPQVTGRIVEKSPDFEPGSAVTEGQVLLRIEDTDYVLAVRQARAAVAQAEVSLAQAEEEAAVARREWDSIGGGDAEPTPLVLREPQLRLAQANLEAARAALRQAEVNLERCTITAPFTGRVLQADVDAGQFLTAGRAVGRLHATDVAEITVPVADADLAWIHVDADEPGSSQVTVRADFAGAAHVWEGRAVRLGGAVDAASRLVPVIVELEDPFRRRDDRPALVEGMFVEVEFTTPPPAGAVVIPRAALRPGDQVWVVVDGARLQLRNIETARTGIDQVVVTGGLEVGELICTSSLQYVTDGMPVRLPGREPAAGGSAPADATADRTAEGGGR